MTKYKVAIIGCGSIGSTKNDAFDHPDNDNEILTHAHAFHKHPETQLLWFVDKDLDRAIKAADKWGGRPYVDLATAFKSERPDIVVVSVPTEDHAIVLLQVLSYGPYLVIAEKPFCMDFQEARIVADCYTKAKIPLVVNYTRRFLPEFQELRNNLQGIKRNWCVVKYTRGFKREASHAIDLCNLFFGDFLSGQIVYPRQAVSDMGFQDPTYGAVLRYSGCPFVYFCPQSGEDYNIFEMEISTKTTIYRLTNNGLTIHMRMLEPSIYGNYPTISDGESITTTKLHKGLSLMADNVVGFLEGREPLASTAKNALEVHRVYDKLFSRLRQDEVINKPFYYIPTGEGEGR